MKVSPHTNKPQKPGYHLAALALAALPACLAMAPDGGSDTTRSISAALTVDAAVSSGTLPGQATACTWFVATNGNDRYPGTAFAPFATLERAREAVLVGKSTAPVNVCLRGGTYHLARPFKLGPENSGTATAPITYKSFPGETAILSGGVALAPTWSVYSGNIFSTPVPYDFNELFVDGVRATRARSPNAPGSDFLQSASGTPPVAAASFVYQQGTLPAGLGESDIEVVSMGQFESPRERIAGTTATTAFTTGSVWHAGESLTYGNAGGPAGDRYYVENTLDALDSPGEWYLDEVAHVLYYWAPNFNTIGQSTFEVPLLHQLVRGGTYPANAGYLNSQAAIAAGPVGSTMPLCRHLAVYPQSPSTLSFGTASFSVASWIRLPPGTIDPSWVFTKGEPVGVGANGGPSSGYGLATSGTGATVPVTFFVSDGTTILPATLGSQPRGEWMHVALVVDRQQQTIKAYLNGSLGFTTGIAGLGPIASRLPLDVGTYTDAGCSSSGVSDFRIFPSALTATEIENLMGGGAFGSPALWLPFNGDYDDYSPAPSETIPFYAPAFMSGPNGAEGADFSVGHPPDVSGSVDYIGLENLVFEEADWALPFTGYPGNSFFWSSPAAVYLHSRHATITGNTFHALGSHALAGMLEDSTVSHNQIFDVGGDGIMIGQTEAGSGTTNTTLQLAVAPFSSGDTIGGNDVHDVGQVVRDAIGIVVTQGEHSTISQNIVENVPYTGIFHGAGSDTSIISLGNNVISLNRVDNVMQVMNDGGGIYITGNQPGTVIERNVVHDVVQTPVHATNLGLEGIYLDGGSQNISVQNNLVYRTGYATLLLQSAAAHNMNTLVWNHIVVGGGTYELYFAGASADTFKQNIVYYAGAPQAQLFFPIAAPIGMSDYNLYYSPDAPCFRAQLAAWECQCGEGVTPICTVPSMPPPPVFDAHSLALDPQFVGAATDDYALQPTSAALQPIGAGGIGFQPLDFSGLP